MQFWGSYTHCRREYFNYMISKVICFNLPLKVTNFASFAVEVITFFHINPTISLGVDFVVQPLFVMNQLCFISIL